MKIFIFYGLFALAKSSIFMNTYANNRLFHNLGHHQKAEKLDLLRDLLCASRNEKELRKNLEVIGAMKSKLSSRRQNKRLSSFKKYFQRKSY